MTGWLIGLSFVAALAFGLWIGRPRSYDQSLDEIEQRLDEDGEHQKVKRVRTVFTLMQRKVEKGSRARRTKTRKPFRLN